MRTFPFIPASTEENEKILQNKNLVLNDRLAGLNINIK